MAEEQTTAPEVQSEQPTEQPIQSEQSFVDTLPEDVRAEPSLKNFQDAGQLAKSYVHAQRMVGADKISVPTKHATDEDWNQVFSKLGVPDSPDKYEVKYELQEGANETPVKNFISEAHKLNLLPHQVQGVLNYYSQLEQGAADTQQKDMELNKIENESSLRKEWGLAYDKKMNAANGVFKNFFATDLADVKLQDGTPLGNHPGFVRSLSEMASKFSEDSMGTDQEESGGITPAEADREIQKILGDQNHPYFLKNHPGHKAAVDEMFKLNNMKFGVSSG
jgi:hypothetical protein